VSKKQSQHFIPTYGKLTKRNKSEVHDVRHAIKHVSRGKVLHGELLAARAVGLNTEEDLDLVSSLGGSSKECHS